MDYPLSKTLDPERDYAELAEELITVGEYFTADRPQHPHRRFEYAMALRAFDRWGGPSTSVADVGGAGSPFWRMVSAATIVIDPDGGSSLEEWLRLQRRLFGAVFCLSVLEHVEDLNRFCYHLACLVAPGGLLFLTFDYCNSLADDPIDAYHFHWMRKRIFSRPQLARLAATFIDRDFRFLGERDFTYHGDHVFNYSFASLALVKRA